MDFPEYDPEKTYFLHDSRYFLGIYYEDPEWVKRKKDDGEGKARLKRRQMEAKEINQDAFEIRSYFVREFKVSNKTKHAEFFEKMLSEVFDWKP